ncbi:MAG: hypothetical protein AW07_04459 [Candidatus Accumulibacter sp. SK-11]|nr:MAG: hypothetical protein AW07_04459 [Candidatus Accumulibacter sp. SK-11]
MNPVVVKVFAIEHCIAQVQRTRAPVRKDMDRIQIAIPRQDPFHLPDAILAGMQQIPLAPLRQSVDQGLVIGDTGIDEDDLAGGGGHEGTSIGVGIKR